MANSDVRFVYTDDNGMVIIVCPADKTDKTLDEIKASNCPADKTVYTVEASKCPTDRSFRDAWSFDGTNFSVNITKAKEIHKNNIRAVRIDKLAELDIEFQRALETSAYTSAIVAKKQALRDAPADSAIDAATDESALKAQWNVSLLGDSPYKS